MQKPFKNYMQILWVTGFTWTYVDNPFYFKETSSKKKKVQSHIYAKHTTTKKNDFKTTALVNHFSTLDQPLSHIGSIQLSLGKKKAGGRMPRTKRQSRKQQPRHTHPFCPITGHQYDTAPCLSFDVHRLTCTYRLPWAASLQ